MTPLVEALDHALCAEPRLAELPGRFLFAIDDGTGDVAGLGADITWTPAGLHIAGVPVRLPPGTPQPSTPPCPPAGVSAAAATMVAAALAFLDERRGAPRPSPDSDGELPRNRRNAARNAAFVEQDGGNSPGATAWRIAELENGPARIAARLDGSLTPQDATAASAPDDLRAPATTAPSDDEASSHGGRTRSSETRPGSSGGGAGWSDARGASPEVRRAGSFGQREGRVAVEVLVPLGRLSAGQVRALAEVPGPVVLTPWRSVVLLDLDPAVAEAERGRLAEAGFVTDPGSPWAGVTACTGSPGCAKSLTDVRADATRWVEGLTEPVGTPVHWAGCERRCGRPRGEVIERVATGDGYVERRT